MTTTRLDMILILFGIYIFIVDGEFETGMDFIEDFNHFDAFLWSQDFGLTCDASLAHTLAFRFIPDFQCYFADPTMIGILMSNSTTFDPVDSKYGLEISAQNGCMDRHCCSGSKCTKFDTGFLISKHTYTYGAYTFYGVAAKNRDDSYKSVHGVLSCFSLLRHVWNHHDKHQMEMSLCIDSDYPFEVMMLWQNGSFRRHRFATLDFDATETLARWKLEWHPDHLSWYVDDEKLGTAWSRLWLQMPDVPMHIRVGIIPKEKDEGLHDSIIAGVDFSMYLFIISHGKYAIQQNKDEPFIDEKVSRNMTWNIFSFLFVCLLCSLLVNIWQQARRSKSQESAKFDQYHLIQDEYEDCAR